MRAKRGERMELRLRLRNGRESRDLLGKMAEVDKRRRQQVATASLGLFFHQGAGVEHFEGLKPRKADF